MAITLAEEIVLLSLDDETGSAQQRQAAGWAVAGGFLFELVLAERVSVSGEALVVSDPSPTGEPLLDGRVELIATWLRGRGRHRATDWLTRDQPKAVTAAVERLCERGVIVEEKRKVLGMFPVRRYPEADGTFERELRARLAAVVLDGEEPDTRTAGLIALIHSAKLHALAFPDRPRKEVAARMAEIADGQWAAESVRTAIRDTQAAMTAVTVVTTTTILI